MFPNYEFSDEEKKEFEAIAAENAKKYAEKKITEESNNKIQDKTIDDLYVKNKLKFIDHGAGLTIEEKKHNDWVDETLNAEREKNYKETGYKETDNERDIREADEILLKEHQTKYGKEIGEKIFKGEMFLGMTLEMVIDIKGEPDFKIEKVSRREKREEYFYGKYKNRLGNDSYKFRVVIINDEVDGWNDIME